MSLPLQRLKLNATDTTPAILFDNETGLLEISGRSLPEDSADFFEPILDWLRAYVHEPQPETTVNISFVYIKTSSFKVMFDVFKVLEFIYTSGNIVNVNWYYEEDDEEIKEMGYDYDSVINIPFTIIEVKE